MPKETIAPKETRRRTLRLDAVTDQRAAFWAEKTAVEGDGFTSFNDFVAEAIENEIARRSGAEIDSENIIVGRLNQLTDAMLSMASQLSAMEQTMNSTFSTIVELARGESTLMDAPIHDDGELEGLG